jgi:uncharacterized membrane protein
VSVLEVHLAINHVPIVGTACALVLLFIGLTFRKIFVQKIALWFLLILTPVTIMTYVAGDQAGDLITDLSVTSRQLLHMHAQLARTALLAMVFVGGCSLVSLLFARFQNFLKFCTRAIFAMTTVCMVLFILTGYLGGQLAYEEIRSPLTQDLSINLVTLIVAGLMMLIALITIAIMFLHRNTLFKIPVPPLTNQQAFIPRAAQPISSRSGR